MAGSVTNTNASLRHKEPRYIKSSDIADHLLCWNMLDSRKQTPSFYESRLLHDFRLVDCRVAPSAGSRGAEEIARQNDGYACISFHHEGRDIWSDGVREMVLEPGCVAFWHTHLPVSFRAVSQLRKLVIMVPDDHIKPFWGDAVSAAGHVINGSDAFSSVLTGFMGDFFENYRAMSDTQVECVARSALELLGSHLALSRSRSSHLGRSSLFEQMTSFIERRLEDDNLLPKTIADAHGISLRYVHLLFAKHNATVRSWIRARRLSKCESDLRTETKRSVVEIAFRWGFKDSAHFSRAFKKQFGLSPSSYRRSRGCHGAD